MFFDCGIRIMNIWGTFVGWYAFEWVFVDFVIHWQKMVEKKGQKGLKIYRVRSNYLSTHWLKFGVDLVIVFWGVFFVGPPPPCSHFFDKKIHPKIYIPVATWPHGIPIIDHILSHHNISQPNAHPTQHSIRKTQHNTKNKFSTIDYFIKKNP